MELSVLCIVIIWCLPPSLTPFTPNNYHYIDSLFCLAGINNGGRDSIPTQAVCVGGGRAKINKSLVIRVMQIRTTMRYHFTPTRMTIAKKQNTTSVDKSVQILENLYIVAGNMK